MTLGCKMCVSKKYTMTKKVKPVGLVGDYSEIIFETVREPLILLDEDLRILIANRSFYKIFHATKKILSSNLSMRLVVVSGTIQNFSAY